MEIYLSHMVMYRLIEKLHLDTVLGNGWLSYVVAAAGTIVAAVVFSAVCKRLIETAEKKIVKMKA